MLSVGEVRLQGQPAKAGNSVQPGDHLSTGADGYLYIKTVDNGFLILRPNSEASIVAYQADTDTPANSRFKIELQQGVARSISRPGGEKCPTEFPVQHANCCYRRAGHRLYRI